MAKFRRLPKEIEEARKKPGGSSVGEYKGERTVGPAGGAPKGSFPITKGGKLDPARGRAALAYARDAPDPAGIKRAVYKAFPEFPGAKKLKLKARKTEGKDG